MKSKYPAVIIPFENEQREYKTAVDKDGLRKEIVAFANTSGGKIMIGIADDRTVVGVGELTTEDISNMARDGCVPPLVPKIDMKTYDGKNVIVVTVRSGQDTPYRTVGGTHYVRVGPNVRIASQLELMDLMVKGSHRDTIVSKTRMPQLRVQISANIRAGTELDQALVRITELHELAKNASDESTKLEIIDMVVELLSIPCSDDRVFSSLLASLHVMMLHNLVENPHSPLPSKKIAGRIVDILKQMLFYETMDPKVTKRTRHILGTLYLVGVGCIWTKHNDQINTILETLNTNCGRDRGLTRLCRDIADKLSKLAKDAASMPEWLEMVRPSSHQHSGIFKPPSLHNIF